MYLNVEIDIIDDDGLYRAMIFGKAQEGLHKGRPLLEELKGTNYGDVCAEVGVCIRAEITRQLENEQIDREKAFIDSRGLANL